MLEWNPRYFAAGREHWTLPQPGRHDLAAVALDYFAHSGGGDCGAVDSQGRAFLKTGSAHHFPGLLAACYLGWTAQAFFLQHLFDYIHVPPIFLAILIVAVPLQKSLATVWGRALLVSFGVLAISASPLFSSGRVGLWGTCLTTRSNPQLDSELAVLPNPDWQEMDQVARFLSGQNLSSGDVCCFHSDLVSLYNRLELLPPTRFVYVQESLVFFPDRRADILERLRESPARFVVTDMRSARLTPEQINRLLSPAYQQSLLRKPAANPRPYPWGYPIVFRSGSYLVHQVTNP